eukprot:TRINITY_DN7832_c0_g1_i1.p1 TRINITY_DN7832_c0_g1~~TRINITY_DN7832_c0_g1_i1.p1  ORF type:complete len:340 (-),score=73.42 TRINITY_DN7832_c0_g1_i1:61-948(-)
MATTVEDALQNYLDKAIHAAKAAGALIKEAFYSPKRIQTKSAITDLVTETDQLAEKTIFDYLRSQYPDHVFVGEESVAAASEEKKKIHLTDKETWVVDPLDGTTNFVHQFPHVAVSIGLLINKEPTIGVVYNPILGELFTAIKGRGAFLSNTLLNIEPRLITTSGQNDLTLSLVASEYGSDRSKQRMDIVVNNSRVIVDNPCHGLRSIGSAALQMSFVSAGRLDAYFETGIHVWDISAGTVLVREAGGFVCDTTVNSDNQPNDLNILSRRILCAATQELATAIVRKLTPIDLPSD